MTKWAKQVTKSTTLSRSVGEQFWRRAQSSQTRFAERLRSAWEKSPSRFSFLAASPFEIWKDCFDYCVDFTQRTVLFWDTLRQRGENFLEHDRVGKPPVLNIENETVTVDPQRRPYLIIDPRELPRAVAAATV